MRSICALVAIASLATLAAADDRPPSVSWEAQIALRGGTLRFDEGTSGAIGLGARFGIVLGRLAVLVDYSDLGTSAPPGWMFGPAAMGGVAPSAGSNGTLFRFGALARYQVRNSGHTYIERAWLSAGLGEELVVWDVGGRLHRPDFAIGFGGALGGRGTRAWGDSFLEVTLWIAPRALGGATTCGGPCDIATPPPPFERSLIVDWGISFGR
jgi:hypothetical protein